MLRFVFSLSELTETNSLLLEPRLSKCATTFCSYLHHEKPHKLVQMYKFTKWKTTVHQTIEMNLEPTLHRLVKQQWSALPPGEGLSNRTKSFLKRFYIRRIQKAQDSCGVSDSLKRVIEYIARRKCRASILNMLCTPGIPAMVQNSPSATPTQQLPASLLWCFFGFLHNID